MTPFACNELTPGCTVVLSADTDLELLREVTAHAWAAHDLDQPHLPAGAVRVVLASAHAAAHEVDVRSPYSPYASSSRSHTSLIVG